MASAQSQTQTIVVPTDAELLQAQADLWRHSLYYLTSMTLKCAVELGIPTAIHNLGGATTLPDLVAALSLPKNKLPFLRRVMRLLVTSGIFASSGSCSDGDDDSYRLNPLSWLLVEGVEAEDHTYQKCFVLATVSRHYVDASLTLADWFKKDDDSSSSSSLMQQSSPFEDLHGVPLLHEKTVQLDEELDAMVKEGVAAHDNLAMGTIIRECGEIFEGLESLTDCSGGGGDSTAARAIAKAYPHIKCNVHDQVIHNAPTHDGVAVDMFKSVPPAQAVLLKLVLHFWNDDDCVNKILEQCRKAIPSREEGGKVIIIETVISPSLGPIMYEAQLLLDMLMFVNTRGRQRDENDLRQIFKRAGFSDYKIVKKIGARGIIEVYP